MIHHEPIDLCITGDLPADPSIVAKLHFQCHTLNALNQRHPKLGLEISRGTTDNMPSGYRPIEWEIGRGRSGHSQHTYRNSMGALDLVCGNWPLFSTVLRMETWIPWTRIAVYSGRGFVHCDCRGYDGSATSITEKKLYDGRWVGMDTNNFLDTASKL